MSDTSFRGGAPSCGTVRETFESAWGRGEPHTIESLLPAAESEAYGQTLIELVLSEIDLTWRQSSAGRGAPVEAYLHRFPTLSEPATLRVLVVQECLARLRYGKPHGDQPSHEEVRRRFPQIAGTEVAAQEFVREARPAEWPVVPDLTVVCELGRGGMGVVYLAKQERLGRLVALKVVRTGGGAGSPEAERFQREAKALALFQNENLVPIYDVGEADGQPYFIQEYVDGGTLRDKIGSQPQPHRYAAEMARTLAVALHAAHGHMIVHRDLKPANVLLMKGGTPKICDFGLAKAVGTDGSVTRAGGLVGTPNYMAPEQAAERHEDVDFRTDVYGLGGILYELLTGQPPFKGTKIEDILDAVQSAEPVAPISQVKTIPIDLNTICLKCLEKRPARRYASAQELADDLQRFLDGEPIRARPAGPVQRAFRRYARWWRHKPVRTTLAHVLTVGLVAGGIWWQDQAARAAEVKSRVAGLLSEADRDQQQGKWGDALARTRLGEALVTEAAPRLRQELRIEARLNDLLMVEKAKAIRLRQAGLAGENENFDIGGSAKAFAEAFREYGIDVAGAAPEAAEAVRSSAIRDPLIATLHDWAMVCADATLRKHLIAVLDLADDDGWRKGVRGCVARRDLDGLRKLAEVADVGSSPPSLEMLGLALGQFGDMPCAVAFFRRAQQRHPNDLLINHHLARHLERLDPPRRAEAAGFLRVVQALYPESPAVHLNLGATLLEDGQHDLAIAAFREAVRRKPDYAAAHENIGIAMTDLRQPAKAAEAFKEVVRHDPKRVSGHIHLGAANLELREFDEAISSFRAALRIDPNSRSARVGLATTHFNRGNAAKRQYEVPAEALKPEAAVQLLEKATGEYQTAVEVNPAYPEAHVNLGLVLQALSRFPEAEAALRRGLDLLKEDDPRRPQCEQWLEACKRAALKMGN